MKMATDPAHRAPPTDAFPRSRTFDELTVGDSVTVEHLLSAQDITPLRESITGMQCLAGDEQAAQPVLGDALFASLITTRFPGPGSRYRSQKLQYLAPLKIGDRLTLTATIVSLHPEQRSVELFCLCVKQDGTTAVSGELHVVAPLHQRERSGNFLPSVRIRLGEHAQPLLERVQSLPRIRMAVVHPCDELSLRAAFDAREAGIIEPILIGPRARLLSVAAAAGLDLTGMEMEDVPHSHAAGVRAAEMAAAHRVDALMKGSLHTDELMGPIVSCAALRTKQRISHCFLMQTDAYPRPFIITDAAINISPSLEDKADIVRNAIDLAHATGVAEPRVAILAAVETINPRMPATLDAAALCKMADRGQIVGGLLDGPLAFDNAISLAAAHIKGIVSEVAGQADALVVPDLESGNMLAKQLEYLAGAASAGIVLGARVPIVLTSRADSRESRLASCAIAAILAHRHREMPP